MKLIALTGGTGFLGIHLIPALLERGYRVRLLRRPGSAHPAMKSLPAGVEAVDVDFAGPASISSALKGADAVIHAAGLVSYDRSAQAKMRDTHVRLTRDALAAAGGLRFVHVSSIVALGHGEGARDEGAEYNARPLRLAYWDTKREAEELVLAAARAGADALVVNPGTLLGSGERGGQFLPFVAKLARSDRPFLPDGGSDFLDVRDAALGTVLALERGRAGERYILGSENLTYAQFHARLRGCLSLGSHPRVVPRATLALVERAFAALEAVTGIDPAFSSARIRRVNGLYLFHDLSKARRELGYSPRPIDGALKEMLAECGL
jgi:dihydroflavonol-4-reductase